MARKTTAKARRDRCTKASRAEKAAILETRVWASAALVNSP